MGWEFILGTNTSVGIRINGKSDRQVSYIVRGGGYFNFQSDSNDINVTSKRNQTL